MAVNTTILLQFSQNVNPGTTLGPAIPPDLRPTRAAARILGTATAIDVLLYRLSAISSQNRGTFISNPPGGISGSAFTGYPFAGRPSSVRAEVTLP